MGPVSGEGRIRWAARLPSRLLERLYESDARGLRDTELCDDVGFRLYARCQTFLRVSGREVECPRCKTAFGVAREGPTRCPGRGCRWSTDFAAYRESVQNHYAHPGRAIGAFREFHRRYPSAKSYADKILAIDALIHSFHVDEATGEPAKSVASKLLEGNKTDVVRFLDELSAVDPGAKERWRSVVARTIHGRVLGGSPEATDRAAVQPPAASFSLPKC